LLLKIKELGSLRKAAQEMKMSYRQAWSNINQMNKSTENALVILKRGGKDGGIAVITEYGEKVINIFNNLQLAFNKFIENQTNKLSL